MNKDAIVTTAHGIVEGAATGLDIAQELSHIAAEKVFNRENLRLLIIFVLIVAMIAVPYVGIVGPMVVEAAGGDDDHPAEHQEIDLDCAISANELDQMIAEWPELGVTVQTLEDQGMSKAEICLWVGEWCEAVERGLNFVNGEAEPEIASVDRDELINDVGLTPELADIVAEKYDPDFKPATRPADETADNSWAQHNIPEGAFGIQPDETGPLSNTVTLPPRGFNRLMQGIHTVAAKVFGTGTEDGGDNPDQPITQERQTGQPTLVPVEIASNTPLALLLSETYHVDQPIALTFSMRAYPATGGEDAYSSFDIALTPGGPDAAAAIRNTGGPIAKQLNDELYVAEHFVFSEGVQSIPYQFELLVEPLPNGNFQVLLQMRLETDTAIDNGQFLEANSLLYRDGEAPSDYVYLDVDMPIEAQQAEGVTTHTRRLTPGRIQTLATYPEFQGFDWNGYEGTYVMTAEVDGVPRWVAIAGTAYEIHTVSVEATTDTVIAFTEQHGSRYVETSGSSTANLRTEPSTAGIEVGDLNPGQRLIVVAVEPNGESVNGNTTWYQVVVPGVEGGTAWVSDYVVDMHENGGEQQTLSPDQIATATPVPGPNGQYVQENGMVQLALSDGQAPWVPYYQVEINDNVRQPLDAPEVEVSTDGGSADAGSVDVGAAPPENVDAARAAALANVPVEYWPYIGDDLIHTIVDTMGQGGIAWAYMTDSGVLVIETSLFAQNFDHEPNPLFENSPEAAAYWNRFNAVFVAEKVRDLVNSGHLVLNRDVDMNNTAEFYADVAANMEFYLNLQSDSGMRVREMNISAQAYLGGISAMDLDPGVINLGNMASGPRIFVRLGDNPDGLQSFPGHDEGSAMDINGVSSSGGIPVYFAYTPDANSQFTNSRVVGINVGDSLEGSNLFRSLARNSNLSRFTGERANDNMLEASLFIGGPYFSANHTNS